jgi:hypothetical protein
MELYFDILNGLCPSCSHKCAINFTVVKKMLMFTTSKDQIQTDASSWGGPHYCVLPPSGKNGIYPVRFPISVNCDFPIDISAANYAKALK